MSTETKTEFAARCNVSPGRVSQWIAAGKIKQTSLSGEGRSAKIVIAEALADLKRNLDITQSIGLNGLGTKLNGGPPPPISLPGAPSPETPSNQSEPARPDDTAEQIAKERLALAKIQTRRAEREEALADGRYMVREDAEAQIARTASMVLTTVESGFNGMADALAAEFGIPRRDVLHTLNKSFRAVREAATRAFAEKAAAIAKAEADVHEDEEEDDQD
ncbi:hypothetical protein LB566_03300 [Mesorhizobium sp. CA13]|uniref:hypothetical protein n=1 Tax=Mesorhizobium sp. CA13 TaxID=2876643 RepID=UPI001CCD8801|nr:hypothetical protein [Mesorhizobium sp. CA13]MBZ9852809.1 hypothetical protein [Mesorhizobium sp. CA13]